MHDTLTRALTLRLDDLLEALPPNLETGDPPKEPRLKESPEVPGESPEGPGGSKGGSQGCLEGSTEGLEKSPGVLEGESKESLGGFRDGEESGGWVDL
eukprot:282216-Amorphochlora_amoeboformis.AAC.1